MRGARLLAAVGVGIGVLFLVEGCFFVRAPQLTGPVLLIGHLLCGVGEETEIPVEVVDFPAPGVAGVAILDLRYDPSVLEIQGIQGKNGFYRPLFLRRSPEWAGEVHRGESHRGNLFRPYSFPKGAAPFTSRSAVFPGSFSFGACGCE